MSFLPFNSELAFTTDYLDSANDFHFVVCGDSKTGWIAKVRGRLFHDNAIVGVAWYDFVYTSKAKATKRARQLLAWVKGLRKPIAVDTAALVAYIRKSEAYYRSLAELCEANGMIGTAGNCSVLAREARFLLGVETAQDIERKGIHHG